MNLDIIVNELNKGVWMKRAPVVMHVHSVNSNRSRERLYGLLPMESQRSTRSCLDNTLKVRVSGILISPPLEQAFRRPQNRERVIKDGWPTVKVR